MAHPLSANTVVRVATQSDVAAILSLLLTSFRQFPLFYTLYSPIQSNVENAKDTLYYWRRRLILDMLDPECDIIVAELPTSELSFADDESVGDDVKRSKEMLRWLNDSAGVSQTVEGGEKTVVGFAIWRQRHDGSEASTRGDHELGWTDWAQQRWIKLELAFWKRIYTRKDVDVKKYEVYLEAEEELSERFYKEPCYQLDNLAVDFRCHRRGLGQLLVQWGLDKARQLQLDANTEAGPMGEGLYRKMGFENVGIWKLTISGEDLVMPVLRYRIG